MENEEYASDSDQSDEDFCPENAGSDLSEEESGSDVQSEIDDDGEKKPHIKIKKNEKKKLNKKSKKIKPPTVRSTRTTTASLDNTEHEKDNIESDEDDKQRSDALWADFLNDTNSSAKTTTKNVQQNKEISDSKSELTKNNGNSSKELKTIEPSASQDSLKVIEILEFAGEEIKITKEMPINQNSNIGKSTNSKELPKFNKGNMKRPAVGGGLGAILGQIGKKTKISVLEKTKLDWDGFKKNEGLTEELQTFNKGKDGYLERQDFLQRTDVRQFEIERNLRQNKRNN